MKKPVQKRPAPQSAPVFLPFIHFIHSGRCSFPSFAAYRNKHNSSILLQDVKRFKIRHLVFSCEQR